MWCVALCVVITVARLVSVCLCGLSCPDPIFSFVFFLMIRRPPRSTLDRSSAASDVYKRQVKACFERQETAQFKVKGQRSKVKLRFFTRFKGF